MITKITNDKQTYFKQFEAINAALERSGSDIRVNSLEDYFSNIRTIASLTKVGSDVKGKFLIMPLDEPFFKIDANARVIEIPANFKKNGIGVQNDHWAEILYFKVDRYYDYQDLASLNIFINWEFIPSGTRNGASSGIKVSKAFAPDPDFEPNQLIFGWIVDRKMTPAKGVLKFSVSFADSAVPGVPGGYQLSTLISQVNINEGLVPSQDAELITVNDNDFFGRITNSAISAEGIEGILDAVVWKTLPQKDINGKMIKLIPDDQEEIWVYSAGESLSDPTVEKCYFPVQSTDGDIYAEKDTLTLAAEAVSPDMVNSLNYLWATSYATTEGLEDAHFDIISHPNAAISFAFVQTNDTVFDANTTYWKQGDTDLVTVSSSEAQEIFAMPAAERTQLYERICLRVIDRGGYYTVRAQSTSIKDVNILTDDETVQTGKTYRKLDHGEYVTIDDPTGNPKANGWYESSHKTCNSPIEYSDKFIHVPNAEVPVVRVIATDTYTPTIGDYEVTNENTVYNYIDVARSAEYKPTLRMELSSGEQNEGIGGIAWRIGKADVIDKLSVNGSEKTVETIMQDSSDRSNSEFAAVGAYKHIEAADLEYELYNAEQTSEEYHLRIFNQRNHTYTVTPDITAMTLSYVAPKISAFDVMVVGGTDVNGTVLLQAGETPNENNLMKDFSLTEQNPSLTIGIAPAFGEADSAVNTLLGHYALDELTYKYVLEEVDYNPDRVGDNDKRMNDRKALGIMQDNKGRNEVEIDNINNIPIPDNDTGYYRIRIETYYHDTKSVAYTDMFHVILG